MPHAASYKDERQDSWSDLLEGVAENDAVSIDAWYSMILGSVLPADSERQDICALDVDGGPGAPALVEALRRAIIDGNIDIEVCYCSVFDQCWTAALQDVLQRSRGETVRREAAIEGDCADVASSGI